MRWFLSPTDSQIVPVAILFPQQRRFNGLHGRPLGVKHWRGMKLRLFSRQFSYRWPRRGDAEQVAQLFAVTGDHDYFLTATRSPDVEQLLLHRISGKDYRIHCLTLAAMRGDRITVIELMIIGRQRPAIFKVNAAAIGIAHIRTTPPPLTYARSAFALAASIT